MITTLGDELIGEVDGSGDSGDEEESESYSCSWALASIDLSMVS